MKAVILLHFVIKVFCAKQIAKQMFVFGWYVNQLCHAEYSTFNYVIDGLKYKQP